VSALAHKTFGAAIEGQVQRAFLEVPSQLFRLDAQTLAAQSDVERITQRHERLLAGLG
jgi:hypothetical protein